MREIGPNKLCVLVRFGRAEHLRSFRERGEIRMGSLLEHQQAEAKEIGDRFEGSLLIKQPRETLELKIDNLIVDHRDIVGPVIITGNPSNTGNVFCLYAITTPTDLQGIDARNGDFGGHFVLIKDGDELLRRIGAALCRDGRTGKARLVEYYDEDNHDGHTGPFMKPSAFAHQSEFRVLIQPGQIEPIFLYLGDLRDIVSEVHVFNEIGDLIDFNSKEARAQGITW